ATDVPLLADNQSFQDIDFLTGSLNAGLTLTLNPLGTVTTANQRYVFTAAFTVQAGATLNVGTGATVLINDGQALTVRRTLNATSTKLFAIVDSQTLDTEGIVVNCTMTLMNVSLTRSGGANGSDNSLLQVNSGGRLKATGSTFAWDNVVLATGNSNQNS